MSRFRKRVRAGRGLKARGVAVAAARIAWDNRETIAKATIGGVAAGVAWLERRKGPRKASDDLRRAVIARDESRCVYCKKKVWGRQLHIDHKQPWTRGGKTEYENLQVTCWQCNREKGDMTDKEYRRLRQRQRWARRGA